MQLTIIGFPGKVNTPSLIPGAVWKFAGNVGQARNLPQKDAETSDFKPSSELAESPKAKPAIRPSFQRRMTH